MGARRLDRRQCVGSGARRDLLAIKPSGVGYDELTPEAMVVTDLDGRLVDGELSPSSDTAAHAYVYKHMPEVGGSSTPTPRRVAGAECADELR